MKLPYLRKKEYMYPVFVKILRTDQGKKILREHQGDKDAQKV